MKSDLSDNDLPGCGKKRRHPLYFLLVDLHRRGIPLFARNGGQEDIFPQTVTHGSRQLRNETLQCFCLAHAFGKIVRIHLFRFEFRLAVLCRV
jgi:hypothetical protein